MNQYHIAFSFVNEDREYVEEVAKYLKSKNISVFYDKFEEDNLWGKNLYDYLSDIYKQATFIIIFISEHYQKSVWSNKERELIQKIVWKENEGYILPVKFDNVEIPSELKSIHYLDLTELAPIQLAQKIIKKLEIIEKEKSNFNINNNLEHKFNYLNSISIKNYFSIDDLKLENLKDKKEIYFVGENGDGKTILLQAILLTLKQNDINSVLAQKYIKNIENNMKLEILEEKPYINNNIFAYGINRNKISEDEFDEEGYSGLFDTPNLQNTTLLKRPEYLLRQNNKIVKEFIPKLEDILENHLKIEVKNDKVTFIEDNLREIEFKLLSEGYKTTIIWLCDLLSRLIKNQKNITKLDDFKAIVLIDEIDLYLHPKWKYDFVYKLRKIFKNIQFVITTHSLVTILGSSKDAVFYRVYKENGITKIGEEINDISNYTANILLSSPLFGLEKIQTRDYKGSDNITSENYRESRINQKIKEKLENNENDLSEEMKRRVLSELGL